MLSRRHIRVKVMQALYMYYSEGEDKRTTAQLTKALDKNITQLYDLYLYLLQFLAALGHFVERYEEEVRARYVASEDELHSAKRLHQNNVLRRLMESPQLQKTAKKHLIEWQGDEDILRRVFLDLKNHEEYRTYVQFSAENKVLEQEILIFILKQYTTHLALLQQHLEEQFYNWLDDRKIAIQMATKSLQLLANDATADSFLQELDPVKDENYNYARELLEKTITEDAKLQEMISQKTGKWEPHLVALIDTIILKMAVSEFLYFPAIPHKVSINEYIELAKNYSTPQSKKFVNGVLDAILRDLSKEKTFIKKL
jgi:transcription antitermination protein NusB